MKVSLLAHTPDKTESFLQILTGFGHAGPI